MKLSGYSTALFSTWYFWDDTGILFDCGDGVCSGILQKARKVKHVLISHADRDHLTGLLQFHQLNARPGLKIYYPADCGSFPALAEFFGKFDPHVSGTEWIGLKHGSEVRIKKNLYVRAFRNSHVPAKPEENKSLSYAVETEVQKLKPELAGLEGKQIAALRKEQGQQAVSDTRRSVNLIYSGDTPVECDGRYHDCETLIHEATFLTRSEIEPDNPRRNKHSSLEQLIPMVAKSRIKRLILGHFSSRYDPAEIDNAIRKECLKNELAIPVHRLLPGQVVKDILGDERCKVALDSRV